MHGRTVRTHGRTRPHPSTLRAPGANASTPDRGARRRRTAPTFGPALPTRPCASPDPPPPPAATVRSHAHLPGSQPTGAAAPAGGPARRRPRSPPQGSCPGTSTAPRCRPTPGPAPHHPTGRPERDEPALANCRTRTRGRSRIAPDSAKPPGRGGGPWPACAETQARRARAEQARRTPISPCPRPAGRGPSSDRCATAGGMLPTPRTGCARRRTLLAQRNHEPGPRNAMTPSRSARGPESRSNSAQAHPSALLARDRVDAQTQRTAARTRG